MKLPFIGLALIAAVFVAANFLDQSPVAPSTAPSLIGEDWINGHAADFKGRVTVLHFWTFACINCKHNLPYYARWAAKYDSKEVQVIGVHTPELDIEKDPKNVREAVKRLAISYPVLTDGKLENWNQYEVQCWPTVFLIDKHGLIRRKWEGELQWNGADGAGEWDPLESTCRHASLSIL